MHTLRPETHAAKPNAMLCRNLCPEMKKKSVNAS